MKRKILRIDEGKCDGCGQCASACAEGAIRIVDGKARLVSESYCDGLGACLGECPRDAITIEEREAQAFDEAAVKEHLAKAQPKAAAPAPAFVCPGSMARSLQPKAAPREASEPCHPVASGLRNWPVQLHLISPMAPYLREADLLLVADCAPFAMPDFHARFLGGGVVAIGCPKTDDTDRYVEKMTEILKTCSIRSLTTVHMQVPCCSGIRRIAELAIANSGVEISFEDVIVGIQGEVIDRRRIAPGKVVGGAA